MAQARAATEAGDRGRTELQSLGDLRPGPALPAQVRHPAHQQRGRGPRTPARPTRAIRQAPVGLGGEARQPLAYRTLTDPDRRGDGRRRLLLGQHPLHDLASTPRRRPGILMNVHPGLLSCGDGRSATTSFAAETRMDNLLVVHS